MPYRIIPFAIAFGIFVLDRITKDIIKTHVTAWETLRVVPGFFNIVHAENPGVAFGLLAESTSAWRNIFLIGLSLTVLVFITTLLWRGRGPENWLLRVGLALVLGGALGNLFDRVVNGTVTDFVEVYTGQHFFPAFNVADSAITIGAGLLLLDMWRGRSKKMEPEMGANEPG
ncbi:MAG: signal peptidase II [Bryobacteraceae bacterium]